MEKFNFELKVKNDIAQAISERRKELQRNIHIEIRSEMALAETKETLNELDLARISEEDFVNSVVNGDYVQGTDKSIAERKAELETDIDKAEKAQMANRLSPSALDLAKLELRQFDESIKGQHFTPDLHSAALASEFVANFKEESGIQLDFNQHKTLNTSWLFNKGLNVKLANQVIASFFKWAGEHIEKEADHYPEFKGWNWNQAMELELLQTVPLEHYISIHCDKLVENYHKVALTHDERDLLIAKSNAMDDGWKLNAMSADLSGNADLLAAYIQGLTNKNESLKENLEFFKEHPPTMAELVELDREITLSDVLLDKAVALRNTSQPRDLTDSEEAAMAAGANFDPIPLSIRNDSHHLGAYIAGVTNTIHGWEASVGELRVDYAHIPYDEEYDDSMDLIASNVKVGQELLSEAKGWLESTLSFNEVKELGDENYESQSSFKP